MGKMDKSQKSQDIDFVLAWVDGNDPEWLREKNRYAAQLLGEEPADTGDYRYRDWDLLRYWFRAVEAYAPWVRKIHFVTCGQKPLWLDETHPKLHLVHHRDYIPAQYLPTFNSHTIELNLHRIEGLAEQFVYFNDDNFLTRPAKPENFFVDGLPRDVFALDAIYFASGSAGYYNGNDITVINDNFKKEVQYKKNRKKWFSPGYGLARNYRTIALMPWRWFPGFYYQHLANSFLKQTFRTVWEKAEDVLDATCQCRFRSSMNVNQWLFKFWQLADGTFAPGVTKEGECFHVHELGVEKIVKAIRNQEYVQICINDTSLTTDFEKKKEEIRAAFEEMLPKKSSFEK